ncbi:aminotransferase class V-fold PLP-dependent enzyme [Nonomuraea gerenzanensis]|uniref:Cysteine desulfurase n=1 Tax=Nonomuraea gerenzanensis TaxID=93944 RepID=A0A1M4E9S8_9ACTN|nr:aminotransferase class V-fold PLP-dependent enzyme [Nonomuraea gerenzanensis]UBU17870.1 aminotransferase class V-fold PLP-dependent enzyme [Nonomuraea gerenzanensis]SBO95661.1 Cysteine desulfurase [Nonomuraea gerenzanensis]
MTPEAFRALFPGQRRLRHLASCSLGARSTAVDEAMARMSADMAEHGAPWELFEQQVHEARVRFAALVGARPDQVAVMPNASVGAYQAASTMDWRDRPRLITTDREFPSVAHVWLAQRPNGAEVVYARDADDYATLIDERTRLVSAPLVGYQDAVRLPVAELARTAHDAGAELFVDAYQAVGVQPVDVAELGCDYLVAGTSKYLLGLPGLAFLYARHPDRTDRDPQLTGWFGRVNPFAFDPRTLDFPAAATRFQTGTPAFPVAYAANAGLRLIGALDLARVRAHIGGLTALAEASLIEQGERVRHVPPERRGAHVGLLTGSPAGLTRRLAERGLVVSPRGDVVRISFHYYSDAEDVAALCAALHELGVASALHQRTA